MNANVIQDFFDLATDRGSSTGDVTHRFIADTIYRLPELKDWRFAPLRHALGGRQLSGIFTARSGSPVFIIQSCSNSYHCRPDYVGGEHCPEEDV